MNGIKCMSYESKTKPSPQELLDSLLYFGNKHAIAQMEQANAQLSSKFPELSNRVNEAKVKFYLASDMKSKADSIIQQCPKNLSMQLDLFSFHLRNRNTTSANEIMTQLLVNIQDYSDEVIQKLTQHLLDNDQFSIAHSLFYPRNSASQNFLPLAKLFLAYFTKRQLHEEAESIITACKLSNLSLDIEFYNLLLNCRIQQKNSKALEETLDQMGRDKLSFTVDTYNQLLSYYSIQADEVKLLQDCSGILYTMSNERIPFNDETFFFLIKKMIRFSNFNQLIEIFAQIRESKTILSIGTMRLLTVEFERANLDVGIGLLMEHCEHFSVVPDMNLYNMWISYLLKRFEIDSVLVLLHKITSQYGVALNKETWRILLEYFASALEIDSCRVIIDTMKQLGVPIENSHYTALMSIFYFTCDKSTNPRVLQMYPFQREGRWHLLKITDSRYMEPHIVQEAFERIFGIPFIVTIHSYNQLLIQTLKTRQLNEFTQIYDHLLKNESISPNEATFVLKIKALLLAFDPDGATQVLQEMKRCDMEPPTIAYALIFHYHCRKADTVEAERLLESFELANNFRVNFVFYSSLLYAYMRKLDYQKVISTFHRLESKYLVTDTETHNYLVEANFRLGQWEEAIQCWETMKAQGIPRNWFTYSILIFNLIKLDMIPFIYQRILPDCIVEGNSISCASFDRLLCFHANNSHFDAVERLISLMNEYEVRFNHTSISFLSIALKGLVTKQDWGLVVQLMYKISTDYAPGNDYIEELFDHVILWMNGLDDTSNISLYLDSIQKLRVAYQKGLLLIPPANPIISFGYANTTHEYH